MKKRENNYSFIDGQNLYFGIKTLGWDFDYARFRIYLKDKHKVQKAFIFLGYIKENNLLYKELKDFGYELIFKEISKDAEGNVKGNVDVDLTLHSLVMVQKYDRAIIVTSDGDFAPLIKYLNKIKKFKTILSVEKKRTSFLLRKACGWNKSIESIDRLVDKIGKRNEKGLPRD